MSETHSHREAVLEVRDVPLSDRKAAVATLLSTFPVEEQAQRLEATLAAADRGTLSLAGLREARWADQRVGVSLTMSQPDGVTLVWPPVVCPAATFPTEAVLDCLMQDICRQLDADTARLGQVLLDAADEAVAARFRRSGFVWQTELFFLARSLAEPVPPDDSTGDWVPLAFRDDLEPRFAQLLEESYQGSLDCPMLEGLRSGDEALASHKLSGEFDPDLWHLFTRDGQDAGVCLLNDHPEQDAVELVYFGVAPAHRGRRLGRAMLSDALRRAAARGRAALFLAVDAQNLYANAIYAEFGFVELARRSALFRPSAGLAGQSSTGS